MTRCDCEAKSSLPASMTFCKSCPSFCSEYVNIACRSGDSTEPGPSRTSGSASPRYSRCNDRRALETNGALSSHD